MEYMIVIEQTETGYSAYSPDVQGCVAAGATPNEVERNMKEAIEFHLFGLREEGYPIPRALATSRLVHVS